jgi:hypothetical protein
MEKITFRKEEVIAFLEDMIISEMATYEEEVLYQNYKWNGKLEKNYTYKMVLHRMRELYNEKF